MVHVMLLLFTIECSAVEYLQASLLGIYRSEDQATHVRQEEIMLQMQPLDLRLIVRQEVVGV